MLSAARAPRDKNQLSMSAIQDHRSRHSNKAATLQRAATADTNHDDAREEAAFVLVAVGAARLDVGVTSPSAVATPPRRVLSRAQILRMPSTTDGRFLESESRNAVWLVWMKLSIAQGAFVREERGHQGRQRAHTSPRIVGTRSGKCPCRHT